MKKLIKHLRKLKELRNAAVAFTETFNKLCKEVEEAETACKNYQKAVNDFGTKLNG